jgi:hypothetical protein
MSSVSANFLDIQVGAWIAQSFVGKLALHFFGEPLSLTILKMAYFIQITVFLSFFCYLNHMLNFYGW